MRIPPSLLYSIHALDSCFGHGIAPPQLDDLRVSFSLAFSSLNSFMHILPYLMTEEQKKLADLEAKAVDQAKATADASLPSAAVWKTAASLLQNVDGPSLDTYEGKESVYVGRKVPIAAGSKLEIPIQVSAPGSIVEYAVELNERDVDFGIEAEREEGVTVVRVRTSSSVWGGVGWIYCCCLNRVSHAFSGNVPHCFHRLSRHPEVPRRVRPVHHSIHLQ